MSKKNIPSEMPVANNSSTVVSSTFVVPEAQPLLPTNGGNGKSGSSALATPFDSIKEFEKGVTADEGITAGVWHNSKKVLGLWTKAETRNAWVNLQDLGWKKFFSGSDSSVVAFSIIAGSALEKGLTVNVQIENDQIIEIYAW